MRKGHGKDIWMDERKSGSQDQRWTRMMNNRWKRIGYVWKGMDGSCHQCRVQVEKEKVNGWISGIGRQWMYDREDSSIYLRGCDPLIFVFLDFFFIFKEFLLSCS